MKVIREGTDHGVFDTATDLRVLVAYQNAAFALRTKAMLEQVARDETRRGRLVYRLWEFNSLGDPVLLPIATAEVLAADIVVFSAQEGMALPKAVLNWTARWLLARESLPQALIASLHQDPEAPEPVQAFVLPYLAGVAKYGRMHFFAAGKDVRVWLDLKKIEAEHHGQAFGADPRLGASLPPLARSEYRLT